MSTNKRARELAKMWHCRCCPCDHTGHTLIVKEIATILDVLVEARNLLARRTLVDDRNPWPLIEKIDAILEGR